VILDDLVSKDNIDSAELSAKSDDSRRHVRAWSPTSSGSWGTRYGLTDLYAHILDEMDDVYDVYIRAARNPDGTLWCPSCSRDEKLSAMRRAMGDYLFSSQMLNMVKAATGTPADAGRRRCGGSIPSMPGATPKREDMTLLSGATRAVRGEAAIGHACYRVSTPRRER